jgi:hypothetical protein
MGQLLLNVPYESMANDPESYAGARVMRMILRSVGIANPLAIKQMYDHAVAYDSPGEDWPYWYIDPGAMRRTLLDFYPQGFWTDYSNTVRADQTAADNQIQSTLQHYQVAAAVLVNGGKHWVCVVGYQYDASNKLTGFFINDPAYNGGGADQYISLAMWDVSPSFTPVSGGVQWLNKLVEIGDPRPVQDPLERAGRVIVRTGDTIITPDEAVELGLAGIRTQLGDAPKFRALEKAKPGTPRLVARLDREGSLYYLVPFGVEGEVGPRAIGTIMVDAWFGDVLSASATDKPFDLWPVQETHVQELVTKTPIPIYESADTEAARLVDAIMRGRCGPAGRQQHGEPGPAAIAESLPQRSGLRDTVTAALGSIAIPRDYIMLRPGQIEIEPIWAWWPCGSISPFHPSYVVKTPWRNVYVNAYSGLIQTHFDFCRWGRLGA